MLVFGIQQFIYTGFVAGLELVPRWIPGHTFWAYFTGAALIAAGVSILIKKRARLAAGLLGILFFVCVLILHAPRITVILRDGGERTVAFETLAMCGGALMLAGTLPGEPGLQAWNSLTDKAVEPGRIFLAISLAVFGVDHFIAARFVAGLIPSWIPFRLFWVYFTGTGFLAAAISIAIKKYARLGAALLGLMFLLWVVVVHAPRVATHLHNGNEWNSAFVALAMSGVGFIAVGAMMNRSKPLEEKRL